MMDWVSRPNLGDTTDHGGLGGRDLGHRCRREHGPGGPEGIAHMADEAHGDAVTRSSGTWSGARLLQNCYAHMTAE